MVNHDLVDGYYKDGILTPHKGFEDVKMLYEKSCRYFYKIYRMN